VPELQKARALWQLNRFDEALAVFEAAAQKYPQNRVVLIDASRALGARFEITRAEALLDRLITLSHRNAQVFHLAGQSYRMIFRPEKAFECFRQALALNGNIPDACLELAVLQERRHQLDEAFASVQECLRLAPDYVEAQFLKARLCRRRGDETAAEGLLHEIAHHEGAHPQVRAQAWSELAQARDRQGDFDAAMDAMLRAKEFMRRDEGAVRRESEAITSMLKAVAEAATPAHFQRWAEAAQRFPPEKVALLTGFPRSGTTLVEQVLDAHPGLVSSDEREAFARDVFPAMWMTPATPQPTIEALDRVPWERLAAQRTRYLAYMAAALNERLDGRVHLDKNPPFTLLIPAMWRLFPELKLIIALRDPRDVVLSCFMQFLPLNTNSVCYLTLERAAARYALDLGVWRRLRDVLPPCWMEVRYEDTVLDLEREARRTLDFLELPWDPAVLKYRERVRNKAVASPTYEAVSKPLYRSSMGRWRNYEKFLAPIEPILAPLVRTFGYD